MLATHRVGAWLDRRKPCRWWGHRHCVSHNLAYQLIPLVSPADHQSYLIGELFTNQATPLLCLSLTCGSCWPTGPSCQSVFEMFFLIYFHRFKCKLTKIIYRARSIQMGWNKFCWIHLEVYYLIKIWNLLFRVFFLEN